MKQRFEEGDFVSTALGDGYIYSVVNPGERNEHILFHPNAEAQKEYNLEDKPYNMNYSEIKKHLTESNKNKRFGITGERKRSRHQKNGQTDADRAQIERQIREKNKRKKSQQKQKEIQAGANARNAAKKLTKTPIDEHTMSLIDFLNEGVEISKYDLLPTMMKAMKELQKELSDYKKVGDSGKIAEITADIQDLNNKIMRKKQGK